jgi:hypothetical protein
MTTYCACENPELNENKSACILCRLPIEPPPPPLGVSVKESINADETLG